MALHMLKSSHYHAVDIHHTLAIPIHHTLLLPSTTSHPDDAVREGLSIGEWVAVCPEEEPVFLQGILNAKVEEDTSPAPPGSILVRWWIDGRVENTCRAS